MLLAALRAALARRQLVLCLHSADAHARSCGIVGSFNVSHEGKYVALAAEPMAVVGVDVAAPFEAREGKRRSMDEQLRIMKDQLTPSELAEINRHCPDEVAMEQTFRKFWSLKEAYTKGRGDGLAFEFNRCSFILADGR